MDLESRQRIPQSTQNSSEVFKINLLLHCTKNNRSEKSEIKLESPPQNVLEVKRQVERQLSIPRCVQIISYDGNLLKEDVSLSALKFRDGDTFRIEYLTKGDCPDILEIISWLDELSDAATCESSDFIDLLQIGLQKGLFENLQITFESVSKSYVNRLYFVDNNGIEMFVKVYKFLLQKQWNQMDWRLKYLERRIVGAFWDFASTESFPLRRLLIRNNLIPLFIQSLLQARLKEGERLHDYDTSGDHSQQIDLAETIFGSIGVLFNLVELPECRLEIASDQAILDQVSCVSVAPSLSIYCPQVIASLFGNLAFTPEAHKYIADSTHIRRLLEASEGFSDDLEGKCLLEYYTFLFLVQICLISPHCINSDWQRTITDKMESFLQTTSFEKIRDLEIKNGNSCSIFMPFVKLAFIPNVPETSVDKLQLVSMQFAIFSLQNMLGCESCRTSLLKERLLDFVICMPQYVPPSLRPQAEELVQMVVSSPDIPEGPPKLLNLVKARLAKMHFGLEEIYSLSVSEIVSQTNSASY